MALPIIWNISRFEGDYEEYHEEFKTDRENINVALAQVQSLDTPASPAEIETLASQVPQVECQDDLSQSLEARAIALCKCRPGVAPIRFRAHDTWPGPAFQNVTRMFVDMPNGLLKHDSSTQTDNQGWPKILDKVAPAERYLVGFIFEITLGNERYARNWSVRRWVEEIIRDLAIDMVHCLHRIDHWRQGGAWPDPGFVVETDSDVVPYRYRGYERHNLWRNRIALTENLETKPGMQEGNQ